MPRRIKDYTRSQRCASLSHTTCIALQVVAEVKARARRSSGLVAVLMASAVELVRRLKERPTFSEAPEGGSHALRPVAGAFLAWPMVAARSWLNNNLGGVPSVGPGPAPLHARAWLPETDKLDQLARRIDSDAWNWLFRRALKRRACTAARKEEILVLTCTLLMPSASLAEPAFPSSANQIRRGV